MTEFLSPGGGVTERRQGPIVANGTLSTATGGFNATAERGPTHFPIFLSSGADYAEVFGDHLNDSYGRRAVEGFFKQQGDQSTGNVIGCYFTRIASIEAPPIPATSYLKTTASEASYGSITGTGFPTSALKDGDTFIMQADGAGGPTTKTVVAKHATLTLTGGSYAAGAPGESITISRAILPGVVVADEIDLSTATDQTTYTALLNSITGLKAVESGSDIVLTVDLAGTGSAGNITAIGDLAVTTKLGASVAAFTLASGSNVANETQISAAELATMLALTGTTLTASVDSVEWVTDTPGIAGSVQFTGGTGVAKITGFDTVLHPGTDIGAGINTVLVLASSGGAWGNRVKVSVTNEDDVAAKVAATSAGSTLVITVSNAQRLYVGDQVSITKSGDTQRGIVTQIDGLEVTLREAIVVPSGGYAGTELVLRETWTLRVYDKDNLLFGGPLSGMCMSALSARNYFVNVADGTYRSLVTLSDEAAAGGDSLDKRPAPVTYVKLGLATAGTNGATVSAIDYIGSRYAKTGFYALDRAEADDLVQLSVPGITDVTVLKGLETYVEGRKDIVGVMALPAGLSAQQERDFVVEQANFASSFLEVHVPWRKATSPITGITELIPPEADVQGITARVHATRNFGKAPAGIIDGKINGILGVERQIRENDPEYGVLWKAGINAALVFGGQGICVYGDAMLDPTGEFGAKNVRYVFMIVAKLFRIGTRFVNFEPNNRATRDAVVSYMTGVLSGLRGRTPQILHGDTNEQAFKIVCNESNNGPLVRKNKKLVCDVSLNVEDAIRFRDISLSQDTRELTAAAA